MSGGGLVVRAVCGCACMHVCVLIRVTSSNTYILQDSKRTLFYYNHILNYNYILRHLDKFPQNSPSADVLTDTNANKTNEFGAFIHFDTNVRPMIAYTYVQCVSQYLNCNDQRTVREHIYAGIYDCLGGTVGGNHGQGIPLLVFELLYSSIVKVGQNGTGHRICTGMGNWKHK